MWTGNLKLINMVRRYLGIGRNINPIIIYPLFIFSIFFSCGQKSGESSQRYVGLFGQGNSNINVTLDLESQHGIISMNESNSSDSIISIEKYFFERRNDTILLENEFGEYSGPYLMESTDSKQVIISSTADSGIPLFGMDRIVLLMDRQTRTYK